jgi:hypothetical protein
MGVLVTVGCKLPNGIVIQIGEKKVKLNGFNQNMIQVGDGFGLTEGVDKEFFDAWCEKHKAFAVVKNGMVFAQKNTTEAAAQGKDLKEKKSGLEQLKPDSEGVKTSD